jgi:hypothetical protein
MKGIAYFFNIFRWVKFSSFFGYYTVLLTSSASALNLRDNTLFGQRAELLCPTTHDFGIAKAP